VKQTILIIIVIFILIFALNSFVLADSLWSDRSNSLFSAKQRNFDIGDLITILIIEQATASQQAETKNNEGGKLSAGPGTGLLQQIFPTLGGSWDSTSNGKGTTTRGGSLKATISVQVKDIYPNGILVLEGRQVIRVNKEEQVIIITGNVRPDDVSSDNSVYSTRIANAIIEFQGKGSVSETQQPGILSKIFHWLF
jgi:flagellar L-ring protein precursor FlgH